MHTLDIKAVADNGTDFYYREEHGWKYLSDAAFSQFTAKMQRAAKQAQSAAGGKDVGNITLTLSSVVDGTAQPDLVISGLSQTGFSGLQSKAHDEQGQILKMGASQAKNKADKHGGRGR